MAFTPKNWIDGTTHEVQGPSTTAISSAALEDLETRVTDYADDATGVFNVKTYGAAGDAVQDDTAEIQATIDAAIAVSGKVVFPPGTYLVSSTLEVYPAGAGTEVYVDIEAAGGTWFEIQWDGGDTDAVLHSKGWKRSIISGMHVRVPTAAAIVCFDIDTVTGDEISSGALTFTNCSAVLEGGAGSVGWRGGHSSTGAGDDLSQVTFIGCTVSAPAQSSHLGWVWEHQNCLGWTWIDCGGYNMTKMWTSTPTSGAASLPNGGGGDGMTWIGSVTSLNATDFDFKIGGVFSINGGRFELGDRFLDMTGGGASTTDMIVNVTGITLISYTPADNIVFYAGRAVQLTLDGVFVYTSGTEQTAAMVTLSTGAGGYGSLRVLGGAFYAAEPFHTISAGNWNVYIEGTTKLDGSGLATAKYVDKIPGTGLGMVGTIAAASAPNSSLYVNTGGTLVWKDSGGSSHSLY